MMNDEFGMMKKEFAMERAFVQKSGERLQVRRGRLFKLVPMGNTEGDCLRCSAYNTMAGQVGSLCSTLTGCIELQGSWLDITAAVPESVRLRYQKG